MGELPKFLKKYFWDTDFEQIDFKNHRVYVLKRILEYGDEEAVRWMFKEFRKDEIKNTLCKFRGYSPKTANFWALILGIEKERIKCLQRSFRGIQKQFWPY
ncbi:MAG: hypothetical protein NC818_06330 [Candidatus Omnitrophica bacterium]|nr:hypothetical protein [Candidatus Omnitrophota bacterium]